MPNPNAHSVILNEIECLTGGNLVGSGTIQSLYDTVEAAHEIEELTTQTEQQATVVAYMNNDLLNLIQNGYTCASLQAARNTLQNLINAC